MTALPFPTEMLPMLAQAAVIVLVGALVPSRVLLVLAAIAAAAAGIAFGVPRDFSKPVGALLLDFAGVFGGLALGEIAGAIRRRRAAASAARIEDAPRDAPARAAPARVRRRGRGALAAGLLGLGVLGAGAAGGHVLGDGVPASWRAAVEAGLARVMGPTADPNRVAGLAAPPKAAEAAPPSGTAPRRAERPKGDLRHCLRLPSPQDMLRCAEGR